MFSSIQSKRQTHSFLFFVKKQIEAKYFMTDDDGMHYISFSFFSFPFITRFNCDTKKENKDWLEIFSCCFFICLKSTNKTR